MTHQCTSPRISYIVDMYWSNSALLNALQVLWHNASPKIPTRFLCVYYSLYYLGFADSRMSSKLHEFVMIFISTYGSFPFASLTLSLSAL